VHFLVFKNMECKKMHVTKDTKFKVVLGQVSSVCSHFELFVSFYHWSMLIVYRRLFTIYKRISLASRSTLNNNI